MKRFVSSVLVAAMLATSAPAWADPPAVVAPLDKGQPAPFPGVLFSPEAVAKVVAERDSAAQTLTLAVQHQADVDAAQLKFQIDRLTSTCVADKSILQAQVDDGKRQINILNDQLKKTTGGPSAPVWIGLGAVSGVILTVVTVFAVGQATK